MTKFVTVNEKALDKLIAYADGVRMQRDQEFSCNVEEDEQSEAELDALVQKLNRRPVT